MRLVSFHARAAVLVASMLAAPFAAVESHAQAPLSSGPAAELAQILESRKLDAIAAKHPGAPDMFVAALHFPGQLLVVWAKYVSPTLLDEKLVRQTYRDIYIDLNSASIPESRVLITDMGADGVKAKRESQQSAFDIYDTGGKAMRFDGNWREDRMSEQDYMKFFGDADKAYAEALQALIAEAKKTS